MTGELTLLDGGLSTALAEQGHDLDDALWTARLLRDDPEAIVEAHLAFLRAGARVIISASYQASIDGFMAAGATADEAHELIARSTELAKQAVRRFGEDDPVAASSVRIAASVGPWGATRHDGSEYRGDYDLDADELLVFHRQRMAILAASGPDLLACETIPSAHEARAMVQAMADLRWPVAAWVTFSCRSGSETSFGDIIEDAAREALASPAVVAIGVNCTAPTHVAELLGRLRAVTDLALVAYPNRGQVWSPGDGWIGDPQPFSPALVRSWVAAGATMVGGCCGVGPGEIAALAEVLNAGS